MTVKKLELGGSEFELFPLQGDKLKQWSEVQIKCATWQALWAVGKIERDFTSEDYLQLQALSCWLVVQALRCDFDFALNLLQEDRVAVIEVQEHLNGIDGALRHLNERR